MRPLPLTFYDRPVLQVATGLLGCVLVRHFRRTTMIGRIVEVEAYRQDDPASHSFTGQTERNEVMFGPGGFLYVYFTYGMHFCANVVTGKEGSGAAVLIRAVEPILGLDHMARRRFGSHKVRSEKDLLNLTRGPARFCQAFHITGSDNGTDLRSEKIFIAKPDSRRLPRIARSGRIGIRHAQEKKWRFYIRENGWVSKER